ncbi:MAG: hypothetical protein LBR44_05365 [Clostridiales Family XIII bacterium]|jgi:hypothetical protein|nr:hypothetical protein [Clostridiales Family XIII bacterium]
MHDYRVDRAKWAALTVSEMLGNISSEVGRSIKARREGRKDREEGAIARALDLFSATAEALAGTHQPYRLREILRARDEWLRLFYDGTFDADADAIDRYFTGYALAARAAKDAAAAG